jgi:arabinofuranosyltransferase
VAVAALVAFWLVGLPVQWTHWVVTKDLTNRRDTHVLVAPVAQYFPFPVRPVIEAYDRMQAWLIQHHIGMRHQEHKTFYEYLTTLLPTRDAGLSMDWGERNVIAFGSIGLIGWVLPNAAVIDVYGLNDRVVARTPVSEAPGKERLMAHSRQPPPGYVECFQPNLQVSADSGIVSMPRLEPLTDDRIQDCEHYDWASRRARP